MTADASRSLLDRFLGSCLENKLIVIMFVVFALAWGVVVAPFDWQIEGLTRDPVPVDAIPDTGENQQIVFTEWMGRSPQDVEDQVSYPLTVALLGIPGVSSIRSNSRFGFSSINVIFDEGVEFYWSRSRILEKLASLPTRTLPEGVQPALGPDATAMGQVFWYTLEGRDPQDRATAGWDPQELRTVQDWYVRYALSSVKGVSEVASVGGYVKEYQIDVDPDAMRAHGVTLTDVFDAVRSSNLDVGARTIEINRVEYMIRGLGLIKSVADIEQTVVKVNDNVPIYLRNVARVGLGPAARRGALDKGGAEAVGGVVVVRYGANPLAVIQRVKDKIAEIAPGLPEKTLDDGTRTRVTVVPFYDRTGLIHETLDTLSNALGQQILVTVVVVLVMVMHLGSSLLITGLLPLAVLMCFIGMKVFGVDANIVALSGIAIAIGTMVDMGIVLCENILRRLREDGGEQSRLQVIFSGASEVGGAVLTAVLTTVVSFLPVFAMEGAEGKLFRPLAYTKTFALLAAIAVSLAVIPPLAHLLFRGRMAVRAPSKRGRSLNLGTALAVAVLLAFFWAPLGPESAWSNLLFVGFAIGGVLMVIRLFLRSYEQILRFCLANKSLALSIPLLLVVIGGVIWRGMGREFMPRLDEGSFLLMPVTMPHASIGEATDVIRTQDLAISSIPEVEHVVGKIGRVDSALDPAPVSMVETLITYKPEYRRDDDGTLVRQWGDHIRSPDDIWKEVQRAAELPGLTRAGLLQPIEVRRIMLETGMRAPMGVKVFGPDLQSIEAAALEIERRLREVPSIDPGTVNADRIVGKPYLEIRIDREAIARYGLAIGQVQQVIEVALGGKQITQTVEGRERYPVRVRYMRELRDSVEAIERILVPAPDGTQIPLSQLADLEYVRGPQSIKSEDTALVGYVLFDKLEGNAEVDVVEAGQNHLQELRDAGLLKLPDGVNYRFSGTYENQVRAEQKLRVVLPVALFIIFLILFFQFRRISTTFIVFSGVFVAWGGGFVMLWLYGQEWFLNFSLLGTDMRSLFQVSPINLSVAVWVGFLALFGIATDNGVIMATYLKQSFAQGERRTIESIREAAIAAGMKRIRPCLMTSATTLLALLPVLTSQGKGSDVMVPMAIPVFGGMLAVTATAFAVPTLYCAVEELRARRQTSARAA